MKDPRCCPEYCHLLANISRPPCDGFCLVLQVQNAKQMNSGLKHVLEAGIEEFRLAEVQTRCSSNDVIAEKSGLMKLRP